MQSVNNEVVKILFELLRLELNGGDLCVEKTTLNDETLLKLFELSKFYDLAHLVGNALNKKGLLLENSEIKNQYLKEVYIAVTRHEQRANEYAKICSALSKAKIPFIPLKGIIIQNIYPQPWMRTSCDIDVLVEISNLDVAVETLKKELNYTCSLISRHDAQLYSPSGVHLELHFTLTGGDTTPQQKAVFENVWAFDENSQSYERKMSNEHFYGYFLLHMAIHLKEGGCGIRPFLDVYLMQQKCGFDKQKCESVLKQMGLLTFSKAVEHLSKVWLSNEEYTELDSELASFALAGGLYGTIKNRVLVKTEKGGKFRYILSRIFIPYKELTIMYPRLKKCPILLPFYEVKRWFNLLSKDKRIKAKYELKTTINQTDKSSKRVKKLLKDLEI